MPIRLLACTYHVEVRSNTQGCAQNHVFGQQPCCNNTFGQIWVVWPPALSLPPLVFSISRSLTYTLKTKCLVRFRSFGSPPYHCHPLSSKFFEVSHTHSRVHQGNSERFQKQRFFSIFPHPLACVFQGGFKNNVFLNISASAGLAYHWDCLRPWFFRKLRWAFLSAQLSCDD